MAPNFFEAIDKDKQRLLKKLDAGEQLTQEDCDSFNTNTRQQLERSLDSFKERTLSVMAVSPCDSPEVAKHKVEFSTQLLQWFSELLVWLQRKIEAIFAKLKEAFQWCVEKTKELLKYLWSLFTK